MWYVSRRIEGNQKPKGAKMTDEKKSTTPMLVPPVAKDPAPESKMGGADPRSGPSICGFCKKDITIADIKFDPTPNGNFLLIFKCPNCRACLGMQLANRELMFPNVVPATGMPGAGGPLDPSFNPSRRG
jgi:hypothetical protein